MKTLNCVCLPDKESGSIIKKISLDVSEECQSKLALRFEPHITIRSDFKIFGNKIKKLETELCEFCSNVEPMELHLKKYGFAPWKTIYLDVEKNADLQLLHNGCMKIIEKYRTSWILEIYKEKDRFKNIQGKQRQYMFKYGYYSCFEYFYPRFTIAGHDMSEKCFQNMKKKLENKHESIRMKVDSIAFFDREMDNRVFMKIPLKG